ncbi:hypothetical protein FRC03_003700 [Tulasnella sp. 419]|nr:hypothetical protein FRC03_003700 [Tulasnella sp. 419]
MSLKAEIETWATALEAFDAQDYSAAIELFAEIADNSKILTNIGLIYASLGEHEIAVKNFRAATSLDSYLAVAYFQAGVSNFMLQNYEEAFQDFEEALLHLRGNQAINYEQLGLKFQLYVAEVLFNKGLCLIYLNDTQEGASVIREAQRLKVTPEHQVIDEAVAVNGEGFTVFSIPPGVLYRPNEKKVRNVLARDWLGKAKLISASNDQDVSTGFSGVTRKPTLNTSSNLARSRSRSALAAIGRSTEEESSNGPPLPTLLARGASTGSPSVVKTESRPTPQAGILKSSKKTPAGQDDRVAKLDSGSSRSQKNLQITTQPSLRIISEKKLPPSPPQSYSPPRKDLLDPYRTYALEARDERKTLADIYDTYLAPNSELSTSFIAGGSREQLLGPLEEIETGVIQIGVQGLSQGNKSKREYVSSNNEESQSRSSTSSVELTKIRVKLHFQGDVRGMTCHPTTTFREFTNKICDKFGYPIGGLRMKFEDHDDGSKVSLRDEMDFEMALETAKEGARRSGRIEGRLVVWCEEEYFYSI